MWIEALQEKTDRIVPVTPTLWAWATILGKARKESNDGRRAAAADRGSESGQIDLLGAFSELLLLAWAKRLFPPSVAIEMADHLYHPCGGGEVKGADLNLPGATKGSSIGVDAKSFDCSPGKRFFAINAKKHCDLGGGCAHYFCVLAAPLGSNAAIAQLVPYAHVTAWRARPLRQGGSVSRNLELDQLTTRYFTRPPDLAGLRRAHHSAADVATLARDPACRARLCGLVPGLAID